MPFLSIAEREMRVAARRPGLYRTRLIAAVLALAATCLVLFYIFRDSMTSSQQGSALFSITTAISLFFAHFVGISATADSLSEEKREGTLGLLFLTDLKGFDIILGKLVAGSISAFYALIATLPVLFLAVLMGGVTANDMVQVSILLVTTLIYSLTTGLFVSVFCRHERKSLFFTFVILLVTLPLPFARWLVSLLPVLGSTSISLSNQELSQLCLIGLWSLTLAFLLIACRVVAGSWHEKKPRHFPFSFSAKKNRTPFREQEQALRSRLQWRAELLSQNPFSWLACRAPGKRLHAWLFLGSLVLIFVIGNGTSGILLDPYHLPITLILLHFFLKIWIISESCTSLVESRRMGALELLLSTPLTPRKILSGQRQAIQRLFAKPLAALAALEVIGLGWSLCRQPMDLLVNPTFVWVWVNMALLIVDFYTLPWVAMWMGMTLSGINRSILKTSFFCLTLPWCLYFLLNPLLKKFSALFSLYLSYGTNFHFEVWNIYLFLFLGFLLNLLLAFAWARPRLLRNFRSQAASRYEQRR